jgi:Transposase domain (DUF772)
VSPLRLLYPASDYERLTLVPGSSLKIQTFRRKPAVNIDSSVKIITSLSPFHLALVTILQFLEGLSDRNAANTVRGRIDWKYLLCLELENPGFDYSVLCEFRSRLFEGGAEHRLFEKVLSILREQKLVKDRTFQRTDSTDVLAAVGDLNRLERVVETLRAAPNVLATVDPDWVATAINLERVADWFAGVDREKTRTSAFSRVMMPLAAPS